MTLAILLDFAADSPIVTAFFSIHSVIAKGRGQRAEGKRLTGQGFSIWRESSMEVAVGKNRNGATGICKALFNPSVGLFGNELSHKVC
jgi:hypothetical protein